MSARVRILDTPNVRSSHAAPTPRAGGVGIVAAVAVGMLVYSGAMGGTASQAAWSAMAGALVLAATSFIDDVRGLPFAAKLTAQAACAGAVIIVGGLLDPLPVPFRGETEIGWIAYPLTLFWIVAVTNAYNFMDGLDGLAAGVATIAGGFLALIGALCGASFTPAVALCVSAGAAGFLVFNAPPARIFMGDVGSQFLGFTFACLAVVGAEEGVPLLVVPLLLLPILFDTGLTLIRRALRGERLTAPHREHLYQLLNRSGWSHRSVSLLHCGFVLLSGGLALLLMRLPAEWQAVVLVLPLILQAFYAGAVLRRARRAGLR